MSTNIFDRLPQFFFNEAPNDGNKYIRILGRENSQRVYKYIRSDYVNQPKNLFQYKIFLPSANGNAYCTCIRYSGNRIYGNIYQCGML